jgi:hypothetical protein
MALKIRVTNPMYDRRKVYAFPVAEYNDYVGEIVPNPSWVKDDHFCLSTGNPQFPFRILEKERIVCGWQLPTTTPTVPTYTVRSKGKTYLVTNGQCNCTGYSYRRTCTHVSAVELYKQRKVA